MSAADFSAWVDRMRAENGWSDAQCARRLGCGINQIRRWRLSDAPAYIALACNAIVRDIGRWAP